MAVTEAQARRVVRRADLRWDQEVADPRDEKGQKHAHHGMLSLLAGAFACGLVRLRRAEDFSEDLGPVARRKLDLPGRVSDTALYELLQRQKPAGFRETMRRQVRGLIEEKVIERDLFPFGVLSIDGKCVWKSTSRQVEGAKVSVNEETGVVTASFTSLRAVLTSSSARPCLDLELVREKSGEAPAFRSLFPRVRDHFGGQFDIVTVDAGLTCRENALYVLGPGKHFLWALKGNQPALHGVAEKAFEDVASFRPRAHTADHRGGSLLFRELHTVKLENIPTDVRFPGAVELWCIRQTSIPTEDSSAKATSETRYFVSSMPSDFLTPVQKLALVRLHWGIENGHHWTLDVALEEDDVRPCQASRDAIEVIAWLRALAYNMVAVYRARGAKKDRRAMSWERAMEQVRDAFVSHGLERALATRS